MLLDILIHFLSFTFNSQNKREFSIYKTVSKIWRNHVVIVKMVLMFISYDDVPH